MRERREEKRRGEKGGTRHRKRRKERKKEGRDVLQQSTDWRRQHWERKGRNGGGREKRGWKGGARG